MSWWKKKMCDKRRSLAFNVYGVNLKKCVGVWNQERPGAGDTENFLDIEMFCHLKQDTAGHRPSISGPDRVFDGNDDFIPQKTYDTNQGSLTFEG